MAAVSAAVVTAGVATPVLASSTPANADTPDQADLNAYYTGLQAQAQPTAENIGRAFMTWNYDRASDGESYFYWADGTAHFGRPGQAAAAPTQKPSAPSAPVTHQAVASSSSGSSAAGGVWAALRQCESGGNYSTNTGNGYGGAYQFSQSTWSAIGMSGSPSSASPAQQDAAAQKLQAQSGWGQWPACSAKLGLR